MTLTDRLNAWGAAWGTWMLWSLVDALIVLVAAALLWSVLRRRSSPQLGYCLFLLVLCKLFVPLTIPIPARWVTYVPVLAPAQGAPETQPLTDSEAFLLATPVPGIHDFATGEPPASLFADVHEPPSARAQSGLVAEAAGRTQRTLSLSALGMILWGAGVVFLLGRFLRTQLLFHRQLRVATPFDRGKLSAEIVELGARLGVTRPVRIVLSDTIPSPAVWGLLRPTLMLPAGILKALSPPQLEWVLLHELAHIRRRDLLISCFQRLVSILHYLNPTVWVANRIINQLREYACDDLALAHTKGSHVESSEAFLGVVRYASQGRFQRPRLSGALGVFDAGARAHCFQRMSRLLDADRRITLRLGAGSVCLLLLAAVLLLPQLRAAHDPASLEAADGQNEQTNSDVARQDQNAPSAGGRTEQDEESELAEFSIVIARHVMLLEGTHIITWPEIEAIISELPLPALAYPHVYFTRAVEETERIGPAKEELWRLHRQYKLKGHSEGSLSPRAEPRYDRIQTAADLQPDESQRVNGTVVDKAGTPVVDAEVVLLPPVDESVSYKACDVYLLQGRIRNPLDEILTHSNAAGQFAVYPPVDKPYYVLAMHPDHGFALLSDDQFSKQKKVTLAPWAGLISEFGADPEKQDASLRTHVKESGGRSEISFSQYWRDLKGREPTLLFGFTHVPPYRETTISRNFQEKEGGSISLPGATVSLLPGEARQLDLGPLTDQQREQLEERRDSLRQRRETSQRQNGPRQQPGDSNADAPQRVIAGRVVDEAGQPVVGAQVWMPIFWRDQSTVSVNGKTDENGEFQIRVPLKWLERPITGLLWTVWLYHPAYALATESVYAQLLARPEATPARIVMTPAEEAKFVVTRDGKPVANATILPYRVLTSVAYEFVPLELRDKLQRTTNQAGEATLPSLSLQALGDVWVTAPGYGVQEFHLPRDHREEVIGLPLTAVGRLKGVVVAENPEWLNGVRFGFSTESTTSWRGNEPSEGIARIDKLNPDGTFEIPEMPAGNLYIDTASSENLPVRLRIPKYPSKKVRAGETLELVIPFERGTRVQGVVRAGEKGVAGATVSVRYGSNRQGDRALTDEKGEYTACVLPGECYTQVIAMPVDFGPWVQKGPRTDRFMVPRQDEAFMLPTIDMLVLKPVRGRLVDQNHQPLKDYFVMGVWNNTLQGRVATNEAGEFTINLEDDEPVTEFQVERKVNIPFRRDAARILAREPDLLLQATVPLSSDVER